MKKLVFISLILSCIAQAQQPAPGSQDYTARRITWPISDPPQKVSAASVSLSGNPGPATYYYWIVANYPAGASSPAGPFSGNQGPNALSVSSFFQISWTPAAGALTYDVLRTTTPNSPSGACNCAVATAVNGSSANDQSNTLNNYTVNSLDPSTANVIAQNIDGTLLFTGPVNIPSLTFTNLSVGSLSVTNNATIGGTITANNSSGGNLSKKYSSSDQVIFVSPNGSDSNDGLSAGSAKLTPQAGFDTATSNGTVSGTVLFEQGTYSCPTTWRSNMSLLSLNSQYHFVFITSWGFSSTQSGAVFNCTSGSNVTLTGITNLTMNGIAINFGNAGGGLVLNSVSGSIFENSGVIQAGSSTQDAVQMKTNATTGAANNTAVNTFRNFYIHANSGGVGSQANALTLTGSGAVNSGTFVTDNRFYALTITGGIKNAIKFELNSDSNHFYGVQINNNGTAQGDALVFNGNTPGSDRDVANEVLEGVVTTGAFNHPISTGTASSWRVQMSSAAEIVPNSLGGTATYTIETTGLDNVPPVLTIQGTIKSLQLQGTNGGVGTGSAFVSLGTTSSDIGLQASSAGVDQKWWDLLDNNGTQFQIRAVKDDNSAATPAITIDRGAGTSINDITLGAQLIGTSASLTGTVTKYNNVNTVGSGLPFLVATVDLTAQAANIGSTTLFSVTTSGWYRVSGYATLTQAATTSSTFPSLTTAWTDPDSSGAQNVQNTPNNPNGNSTAGNTWVIASLPFRAKTGTTITYQTTGYVSTGATPMQYSLHLRVEQMN